MLFTGLFNVLQATATEAPSFAGFTFAANFASIAFQIIVPFSGDIAGQNESGRAIGISLFGEMALLVTFQKLTCTRWIMEASPAVYILQEFAAYTFCSKNLTKTVHSGRWRRYCPPNILEDRVCRGCSKRGAGVHSPLPVFTRLPTQDASSRTPYYLLGCYEVDSSHSIHRTRGSSMLAIGVHELHAGRQFLVECHIHFGRESF